MRAVGVLEPRNIAKNHQTGNWLVLGSKPVMLFERHLLYPICLCVYRDINSCRNIDQQYILVVLEVTQLHGFRDDIVHVWKKICAWDFILIFHTLWGNENSLLPVKYYMESPLLPCFSSVAVGCWTCFVALLFTNPRNIKSSALRSGE